MNSGNPPSLRAELSRKAIHAATAVLPVAWSYGWLAADQVRLLLLAASLVALLVELLRRQIPALARRFEASVGHLLRAHEHGAVTGATWLALAMTTVAWFAPTPAAIAALWAAAIGDASAAVAGRIVTRHNGQLPSGKTLVGSAAAALTTALGVWWLTPSGIVLALTLGVVAAIAERPRWTLDDNLRVIAAVAIAATALGLQ